jgi:Mn-dependent DtxR family transcriptional regulator
VLPRKRGRRGNLGKEIVSYLRSAKTPVMPLQIRKDLNALATSVSTTLNRLAKAGHVKRDKSGRGWTA